MSNSEIINNQLENIYINLASVQGNQINAITKQKNMNNIIDTENKRLLQKKQTIDQAVENQKRIIYFNDNSRKINLVYLRILITIAISLGMVFVIRIIFNHFNSYIPEMLFNILIIVIISMGIIISFYYYKTIIYRDPYNFDELKLSAPKINDLSSNSENKFGPLVGLSSCIGPQCCSKSSEQSPGTQWSEIQGKCVYSPISSEITKETTVPSYSPEPFYSILK